MSELALNGDNNLVRYTLVTLPRGRERVLKTDEVLVHERMSRQTFVNQVIADYFSSPEAVDIGPEAMKALRVGIEILACWPRSGFGYETKQIRALEEIRAVLAAAPRNAPVPVEKPPLPPLPPPPPPPAQGLFDEASFDSLSYFH